ncbi:tail fiber protein [Rhizobium phage Paso]|uniref:Tail fiber protein n=1 Tax=Rhizobium phage Paso TaxID=2767574 RepID=A0A7L8G4S1_9CAUD|nr:tail fiber protein [Rhizobium phage Paso]
MALSRVIRTGNGTTTEFVVDFALGYLDEDNVTARVGDEVDGAGNPIYRTITFLSDTLMRISGAPAGNGVRVVFERTVEKEDTIVHFSNGDVMDEENLDLSFKQILMVVHEVLDGRFGQFDSNLDMGGFVIKNMGLPVDNGDAANKQYVDGRLATNESLLAQTITARNAAQASATSAGSSAGASATSASAAAASAAASETSRSQSANSATASATSASAAAASAASMTGSVTAAQTARAGAESARDTTLTYRDQAAGHVTSAQTAATASGNSATASETSRQASGTSATASANSATASQTSRLASEAARDTTITYRDEASASATASAGSATTSATHRDNAYKWASSGEDVQVDDGVRAGYSAYHWSKKAELAAGGGVSSWAGLIGTITTLQASTALSGSFLSLTGGTLTGRLVLPASTVDGAPLQLPHGVAPTTPVNGEMWTTTTGLLYRINGANRTSWDSSNLAQMPAAEANAGTSTTVRTISASILRGGINAAITGKADLAGAAFTGNISVAGTIDTTGNINLGSAGTRVQTDGNVIFSGSMSGNNGSDLNTALLGKAKKATVSTADPSGGVDGDTWYKV